MFKNTAVFGNFLRRRSLKVVFKGNLILLLSFIVICLFLGISTPNFATIETIITIFLHASYIGIVAIGMCLVILTGGIDLSVGSVLAISGSFLAGLQVFSHLPLWFSLMAAIVLAVAAGLLSGVMVSFIRMPAFVVTLAGLYIYRGIVLVYTKQIPIPMAGVPHERLIFWGVGNVLGIPISIIVWLFIAALCYFMLKVTKLGLTLYAVGENELVARLSGLNVRFSKTLVYVLSALLAGLAGILLTPRFDNAQPVMGDSWEFDAIACAVVGGSSLMGGTASIVGVVLGTLIITVIRTGLNMMGMPGEIQSVAVGVLLIFVVSMDMLRKSKA